MTPLRGTAALRIALAAVVVAGAVRVLWAERDRTVPAGPLPADSARSEALRAREDAARVLGERAARADSLARLAAGMRPARDPFRTTRTSPPAESSPAVRPAPRPTGYAIPRVARLAGEGTSRKIVLSFGAEESRPLGPGDSDRGWKVLSIEASRVLVEQDGIIYTLPLP